MQTNLSTKATFGECYLITLPFEASDIQRTQIVISILSLVLRNVVFLCLFQIYIPCFHLSHLVAYKFVG